VRRGVFDVLRRGLDNTIVNWPLLAIRLGETLLFGIITVVAVIAALVPLLVSIGIHLANIATPEDAAEAAFLLMHRWMLLVWILVVALLLTILFVAIHSFVQAGSARVYVDGERIAGPQVEGERARFRVFSMDRWMAGGGAGWWTLFWLYNLAWGAAGLVLLVPLIPTLVLMVVFREQPPALVATGCIGLVATLLLMIVVGLVTGMWTNRAIAHWAVTAAGARESLSAGWRAIFDDFARHVLIALAVVVVAIAGSMFFSSFSLLAAFGESMGNRDVFMFVTLPARIAGSLLGSAFSAAVSGWYLASYAGIAAER
jgi:hypothetical protein